MSGIELRGSGTTVEQLRKSLAGNARLSGHLGARADRFLQLFGSAVTGATGGVIDSTLGNIASALGERGGLGIANLLNAISLVLHRFVNHDNQLSGQVDISGGLLTDHDLRLQGNGATAVIATRTGLAEATTDTTINFMLAEDPTAPYLIVTARGPLASPSYGAVRGSAKDPPGMTGILKGVGDLLPKGTPSLPRVPLPSINVPVPNIPNPFGR